MLLTAFAGVALVAVGLVVAAVVPFAAGRFADDGPVAFFIVDRTSNYLILDLFSTLANSSRSDEPARFDL